MVIKSFNVDAHTYAKFSEYCKEFGLSMSKQINLFMASQIEEEPMLRKEYIEKMERISKGRFIRVDDFEKRYGLK